MILVDTSVWIDHLNKEVAPLFDALEAQDVLIHPLIIGELACGEIRNRRQTFYLLSNLPSCNVATDEEVLLFIENHRLMGRGIGYIDAHLLASVTLTDAASLWTRDKRLVTIAEQLHIAFGKP